MQVFMKNKFYGIVLFLIVLIAGLIMGGCINTAKNPVPESETSVSDENYDYDLVIMHVDAENEAYRRYISETEELLGIRIKLIQTPANADNRHAKISTMLSAGDTSVDLFSVNDEMVSEFKYLDYLEPLGSIMTPEIRAGYPTDYIENIAMLDGEVYSVPYLLDILLFWVNEEYLEAAGISEVRTLDDFIKLLDTDYGENSYGYGGAWETTYLYNDVFQFIHMFGGSDWTDEGTKEALTFLYDALKTGKMPESQLFDQYEQTMQKFLNGQYGSIFMYSGAINTFIQSEDYGEDKIHLAGLPQFASNTTNIATWQYVLNKASKRKEAAALFLEYAASKEGSKRYAYYMSCLPARLDVVYDEDFHIEGLEELKVYIENAKFKSRPLTQNAMDDIRTFGQTFHDYLLDELTLDAFCERAKEIYEE